MFLRVDNVSDNQILKHENVSRAHPAHPTNPPEFCCSFSVSFRLYGKISSAFGSIENKPRQSAVISILDPDSCNHGDGSR